MSMLGGGGGGLNIGTAFIEIRPRTGEFESQTASGIGGTVKKIAGAMAATFAAVGVKNFLESSVAAARESNAIAAQTEAVIRSTGGAAQLTAKDFSDLANAIAAKTGIDDEQIQSGENLLATFTNIRNEVGKGNDIFNQATKIATDMSAALGQDMKSSAIQLGKALNDPIQGMTALRRVGVSFSADQVDLITKLQKSGDIMGAQKLILAELSKEFGGSAEAVATAGDRFQVVWGNVKESIGNLLIPVLDKLLGFIADRLPGAIDTLQTGIKALGAAFSGEGVTSNGFVGFMERIGVALREVIAWVRQLADFYGPRLVVLWNRLIPIVQNVVGWLLQHKIVLLGLVAAVGLIFAPFTTLAAAFVVLYARSETFRDAVDAVARFLAKYVPAAIAVAATALGALRDAFETAVGWIQRNVVPPVRAVVGFVVAQIQNLVTALASRWAAISEAVGHAWTLISTIIKVALAPAVLIVLGIVKAIQWAWAHFHDQIVAIAGAVWDQIRNVIETAMRIIGDVIDLVLAVINGDWGAAWDAIKDILGAVWDFIVATIGNALTIIGQLASAGLVLLGNLFAAAWAGIVAAVSAGIDMVISFMAALPGRILGAVGDLLGLLVSAGSAVISGLWNGIQSMWEWFLGMAASIPGWITSGIGDLTDLLHDAAVNLVVGFWHGLESMKDWLFDKVGSFFGGIKDKVLGVFGIGSPSKVFRGYGVNLIEGLANGIESQREMLRRQVGKLQGDVDLAGRMRAQVNGSGAPGVSLVGSGAVGASSLVIQQLTIDLRGVAPEHAEQAGSDAAKGFTQELAKRGLRVEVRAIG